MASHYNLRPPAAEFMIEIMKQVGIIGWRGMVGSVLLEQNARGEGLRPRRADVFQHLAGGRRGARLGAAAARGTAAAQVQDANDIAALAKLPMLISAQGGDYTDDMHPRLRAAGWQGYWIDAASTLRMQNNAVIVLDPVNLPVMQAAREDGIKDFIGGNCTVSLMLMAVGGLMRAGAGRMDHRHDLPVGVRRRRARTCANCSSRWAPCIARPRRCCKIPLPAFSTSIAP